MCGCPAPVKTAAALSRKSSCLLAGKPRTMRYSQPHLHTVLNYSDVLNLRDSEQRRIAKQGKFLLCYKEETLRCTNLL